MANEIKAKFGSPTALTITLASLASSTSGVGRQSTLVDNSTTKWQRIHILGKITTGTSPVANKSIFIYFIKGDATRRTDGAGGSDAALTVLTADLAYGITTNSTSNQAYQFGFSIESPGPEWGLAVVHDTNVPLNSTGGNHGIYFTGENPEVQ